MDMPMKNYCKKSEPESTGATLVRDDDGTVFVITDDLIRHDFDDEEMAEAFIKECA